MKRQKPGENAGDPQELALPVIPIHNTKDWVKKDICTLILVRFVASSFTTYQRV
jgi:hypothetical protein